MAYRLEKTASGYDIVIDGWDKGIESPYSGISDMRNVDLSIPGEVSVALAPQSLHTQAAITNELVTYLDDVNEVLGYNGTGVLEVGTAIIFTTTGTLPTGLAVNTPYYIKAIVSPGRFTISSVSAGGAALNFTGTGTGAHSFSTINMGIPKYIKDGVVNANPMSFMVDSNGRCWVYDSSYLGNSGKWIYMHNMTTEDPTFYGNGSGLAVWKDWLFVWSASAIRIIYLAEGGNLSTLAYLTTGGNWSTWKSTAVTTAQVFSHETCLGQDDVVYFLNGVNIGAIKENASAIFSPTTGRSVANGVTTNGSQTITSATMAFTALDLGSVIAGTGIPVGSKIVKINSATSVDINGATTADGTNITFTITTSYTYSNSVLDIPSSDDAVSIEELGKNLLIGGKNHFIYPWDRIAPSFDFPLFSPERLISKMITVGPNTYIFAGYRGNIYVTNGSNVSFYKKIPDHLSNTVNPYIYCTGVAFDRQKIYFGIKVQTNSGSTINQYGGLWCLDTDTGSLILQNKSSYATYSGYVGAVGINRIKTMNPSTMPSGDGYGLFVGWYDGTVGGVDKGTSVPYVAGEAYVNSGMIPLGEFLTKKTPEKLEFKLGAPLVAGESVAIYYRTAVNGTFVNVPLVQGGGTGEVSGIAVPNFEDVEWIEIQTILTSTASSPSYVRLKQIRIR